MKIIGLYTMLEFLLVTRTHKLSLGDGAEDPRFGDFVYFHPSMRQGRTRCAAFHAGEGVFIYAAEAVFYAEGL